MREFSGPAFGPFLLALLKRRWPLLAGLIALALAEALAVVVAPVLVKRQLDALGLVVDSPLRMFLLATGLLLAVQLFSSACGALSRVADARGQERLIMDMDRAIYDRMARLDVGFLENPRNRKLVYMFFEISHLPWDMFQFFRQGGRSLVWIAGVLPLLLWFDWRVVVFLVAGSLLQILVLRRRIRRENTYRLYRERRMAGIREMMFLLRYHYHQVLALGGQEQIRTTYWERREQALGLTVGQERIGAWYQWLFSIVGWLLTAAVASLLGLRVLAGELSIGSFVMLTAWSAALVAALAQLHEQAGEWARLSSIILQWRFFWGQQGTLATDGIRPAQDPSELVLDHVSFSYPVLGQGEREYIAYLVRELKNRLDRREAWKTDRGILRDWEALLEEPAAPVQVLDELSVRFGRDSFTAVVGANGAGKTTLLRLLNRHHDPGGGRILWSGEPLSELTAASVRSRISLSAQTPFLMESFTIRENLTFGCDPIPSDDHIYGLLERLDVAATVRSWPGGLDAALGEDVTPSGGQAQLLVLARALLQARPVLILDEGTNQLDALREQAVLELLHEHKRGRIVILVTHRLPAARKADRIVLIADGRVAEAGTHAELMSLPDGRYRNFWEVQMKEAVDRET
ncbi:ABC transporter ATP-binding protein/permease [Myxococcota bacterium]|nr:ABC transporter ATP-binding protein/permease [Myxococcota bacterium]